LNAGALLQIVDEGGIAHMTRAIRHFSGGDNFLFPTLGRHTYLNTNS